MKHLRALGLRKPNYDKAPHLEVRGHSAARGWDAVTRALASALEAKGSSPVLAVDCYTGVFQDEIRREFALAFPTATFFSAAEGMLPPDETERLVAPDLGGDDPIFGRLSRLTLDQFFDRENRDSLARKIAEASGLSVVIGVGASLCCEPDVLVYADMPRWEGQLRQRRGEVCNLGADNSGEKASLQYKRSFFIDWRVADRHKRATMERWDFLLDTTVPNDPKLATGEGIRHALEVAARRPFRVVPFFDPGPWGGQWMREVCDLPDGPPNYAWCFDCVPEENSLLLRFGDVDVEIPAINLVFGQPNHLLGETVFSRFGAEFPIRFDFLDTMGGGNLSFQVHPTTDFAREQFGLCYTQDESYYILDAEPNAEVYLGCANGTDAAAMIADLEAAQRGEKPFDDRRFVARFPARKHDHFLIPAGTLHCSGAGSMVLEISATPYIFTFKLWDWARLGLDGLPRPVNIERGSKVINWNRDSDYARDHLVNQVSEIARGDTWREERTGLHEAEFIETRRHWFAGPTPHDTQGTLNVLNLVQGTEAIVESPTGAFEPFIVHYAETFIVPAAVGPYTIRPHGEAIGTECATVKAFVRSR
jgi:mannose-6-phosphate isomerase class I